MYRIYQVGERGCREGVYYGRSRALRAKDDVQARVRTISVLAVLLQGDLGNNAVPMGRGTGSRIVNKIFNVNTISSLGNASKCILPFGGNPRRRQVRVSVLEQLIQRIGVLIS